MGRRSKNDGKMTIHYVEPTYASEVERQAAQARAKEALNKLARLLGKMAAQKAIREAQNKAIVMPRGGAMSWDIDAALADFQMAARLAGAELPVGAIAIDKQPAPHVQPSSLPAGSKRCAETLVDSDHLSLV